MSFSGSTKAFRDAIKAEAERYILRVSDHPDDRVEGKRKGADFLRQVLTESCLTPPVMSAANLRALETPGMWLNLSGHGGTTESTHALHWCGIFATYVLRHAGAEVKWKSGVGIEPSGKDAKWVKKYRRWMEKFADDEFEIGDVAAIPRANHHFIVVDVSDSKKLGCIAGNGNYQRIERQSHDRKTVNCVYKIVYTP